MNTIKGFICSLLAISLLHTAQSQHVQIIPQPVSLLEKTGQFLLSGKTTVYYSTESLKTAAEFLRDFLKKNYAITLPVKKAAGQKTGIQLALKDEGKTKGSYSLITAPASIQITGNDAPGTFYGVQTLIQLLPVTVSKTLTVPAVEVIDAPRFAYRGLHLDVSRHFFPLDFIKKYIDYIALHKMNYFHWHLTDDQGWRIEIKKYPRLTSVGAYRNGTIKGRHPGKGNDFQRYGGFYTQEDVKEIVKYAAARHITVVPEIEMPGHASAAIAAYPELSCFPQESTKFPKQSTWSGDTTGKQVQQVFGVFEDVFVPTEKTFSFLQDVLDEVIALFPSTYIHIGGDECPKDNWKRSAFCQQLIKEKGLKDEHGLQSYFIQRMEKYINGKGRKIIGWDEILEGGLAPNATVMSWTGIQGGIEAAKQHHDVIMTPGNFCYLDHSQTKKEDSLVIGGYTPLQEVYSFEPVPSELTADQAKYILGAQGNVWTEYMHYPSKVEYMIFPRLSALSEVLWSPKSEKNWPRFSSKMQDMFKRYDLWKVNYSKAFIEGTDPFEQKK